MSSLKYQLKSVIASLSAEANRTKNAEIKKRFYLIKAVVESKKDIKKTCESRGFSTDYFYKWGNKLLNSNSLLGLSSTSKSPKVFWNKTNSKTEKKIIRIRKKEPYKGPERISFDLKKKFNIVCPPSTVAAVLKRKGLITAEYKAKLTKKHIRRYRRPLPGYLQMDFKYTPFLLEGKKSYQLSVVDHHSSWRFIRSYQDRSITTVISFLNELLASCPFPIMQIQTDNASEFTDKFTSNRGLGPTEAHAFDLWCQQREIEHKLIPIGEKEINGKVENTHRFDDREFFSQLTLTTHAELAMATIAYNHRWNYQRPTKTLGWSTPIEVVENAFVRALAYLKLILPAQAWITPPPLIEVDYGLAKIIATKTHLERLKLLPKKRSKKNSALYRYLQYLDWEDRNKLRSFTAVPLILQDFSVFGETHK
jgi:hypothetical protein